MYFNKSNLNLFPLSEYVILSPTIFTYITHQSAYYLLLLLADDVTPHTTHVSSHKFSKNISIMYRHTCNNQQ